MTEYKGVASGILDGGELEVRCFPDPVLKKPAEPVEEFDEELADFVARMRVAMQTHDGVGLAAPQVGVPRLISSARSTLEIPMAVYRSRKIGRAHV